MVFVAALGAYLLTLCPTVWVGDSGELIAAAHGLGIPHPTGYPLWLLLAKAFTTVVPVESVAWRANLLSAVCAAAAAEVLARALRRLGCGQLAAAGAALSFAFLSPIWGEATVARTYPLAALCSAAMLWSVARWLVDPRDRWLGAHNLALGLGMANHWMVAAHVPALLAIVAGRCPRQLLNRRSWGIALASLLPGALLYVYLPARAAADPPLEYRVPLEGRATLAELTELPALAAYLRRDVHQERAWAESWSDHATIAGHHLRELGEEFTPVGVALIVVGAIVLWRGRRRGLLAAVALLWAGNLAPLALHGAWWDIFLYPRYLTTGYVGLALVAGAGLDRFLRSIEGTTPARRIGAAAAALALPALQLACNWRACDRSDGWLAQDYADALLAEAPPDAQILSASDGALYPLMVRVLVDGRREDVGLVSPAQRKEEAEILLEWRARKRGLDAPPARRPAFTPDLFIDLEGLERERAGLLHRLRIPGTAPAPLAPSVPPSIRGLDRDDEPDPFARSLIGAIEADLADAAAVRGDREQARARLARVVRLRCPRPWGNATGITTLERMAEEERAAGRLDRAREDLELALELAQAALESGDPRDPFFALKRRRCDGFLGYLDAQRFKGIDEERGFEGLRRAAENLLDPELRASFVHALVERRDIAEALRYLELFRRDHPADRELEVLQKTIPRLDPDAARGD